MPQTGMKNNTDTIRIVRLIILMKNEIQVLPIPLIMLNNVLFEYKNGQIQAKVIINFPANGLLNNNLLTGIPKLINSRQHIIPSIVQEIIDFFTIIIKSALSLIACISETVGSNMVDIAFVIADGNKMHGRAIPLKTP